MDTDVRSEVDRHARVGDTVGGSRRFIRARARRRAVAQHINEARVNEARGPAACMRRDALFRRLLAVADVIAIVGAFGLTVALSQRSVQLTWESMVGVPILLVGAKLLGLYDRDETLLRKTTLDEAPKLFHAGDAVHAGRVAGGRVDRRRRAGPPARRCSCGWRWAAADPRARVARDVRAARGARPSAAC